MIHIEAGRRWYPRQSTRKGHIDEPRWAKSAWESSRPAQRVEDREHERRRREANPVLAPGMLVIFHRQPCRIVEIREQPADLWPEQYEKALAEAQARWDRDPRFGERPERSTWRKRPMVVVLTADEPAAKEQHWSVPADRDWDVLPEHYMVCRQCGQLPPCDDELTERTIDAAVGRTEQLMSIQAGCCLGCGLTLAHPRHTAAENMAKAPEPEPDVPRCGNCRHPRSDHSGRRDGWQSKILPRRPWCHACDAVCDYNGELSAP